MSLEINFKKNNKKIKVSDLIAIFLKEKKLNMYLELSVQRIHIFLTRLINLNIQKL